MGGNDDGSHGTGHEDEYQGGWSTFWLMNPYSLPLFGEPKTENLIDVFGQVNGSTTVYRLWPGKIPYAKSIRISTEHGNNNAPPEGAASACHPQRLLRLRRQFNDDEVGRRIQVILAGLIYDPEISFLLRVLVRDDYIDLPFLQIVAVLVLNAQRKSAIRMWLCHGVRPIQENVPKLARRFDRTL